MSRLKFVVFGKNGQLGKEFERYFKEKSIECLALSRQECDITDFGKVQDIFKTYKPDVVINTTAYNLVDNAEKDYSKAYKVNAYGVKNLAYLSKEHKAYFITYSTDYVFDGSKETPYSEEDQPNPINEYGKSKLTGEVWTIEENLDKFLIFRVSWVYGNGNQNFVYKLLNWAKNSDRLKIAIDEFSVPTPTSFIVKNTLKALDLAVSGIYHLVPNDFASRYEWAKLILKKFKVKKDIIPVSREYFNLPAKRPGFSALSSKKVQNILNQDFKSWDELFKEFEFEF